MTVPQIPEAIVPGLKALREMPPDAFDQLWIAAELLSSPTGIDGFAEQVEKKTVLDRQEAIEVLSAVLSIMHRADLIGRPQHDFVKEVVAALTLDEVDSRIVEHRVDVFAGHEQVQVLSKGLVLARLHDSVFLDARITSDIRPIFGENVEQGPSAVLLIHSLKLDILQDGEPRSVYLAMDRGDLDTLRSVIERAIEKASALTETLESVGLSNLAMEQ